MGIFCLEYFILYNIYPFLGGHSRGGGHLYVRGPWHHLGCHFLDPFPAGLPPGVPGAGGGGTGRDLRRWQGDAGHHEEPARHAVPGVLHQGLAAPVSQCAHDGQNGGRGCQYW